MTMPLHIAVADDEADMRDFYCKILPRLGYDVVACAENGVQLVEECRKTLPDLVLTDIKMPEMDGLDAVDLITHERPVPVIIVSAYHDAEFLERARRDHILAYLVKPIKAADLEPAIMLARQRFAEFVALRQQSDDLRQALEDRKLIERAKGILMNRSDLDEQSAFTRMQKLASEKNLKLAQVATSIITAEEALTP